MEIKFGVSFPPTPSQKALARAVPCSVPISKFTPLFRSAAAPLTFSKNALAHWHSWHRFGTRTFLARLLLISSSHNFFLSPPH